MKNKWIICLSLIKIWMENVKGSSDKYKQELFISKLSKVFPNLTVLSQYKNCKVKVFVKDEDELLYYVRPEHLLNSTYPSIKSAVNKEYHLQFKIKSKLPGIKIIGKYKGNNSKIKIIDTLGIEYLTTPAQLLQGCLPRMDSAINKNKAFSIKASIVHNNKYNYSLIDYINSNSVLKIICPIHGAFNQVAEKHLSGANCQICVNETKGWEFNKWGKAGLQSNYFDNFKIYIIECWNEAERFYKIGKTFTKVSKRYIGKREMPYNWKLLHEIIGDSRFISELEISLRREHKVFRHIPEIQFEGWTECFTKINKNVYIK